MVFEGKDSDRTRYFVEIFAWLDAEASARARDSDELMQLWSSLEDLCESRNGRPRTEFPHVKPVEL
jgi:hypothetical protein